MPIESTIWELEEHTKAKHEILREYLKAWFPIISSQRRGMNYIDGFAGPGIYSKGEEGSPLIAMRTVLEHVMFRKIAETQIRFHFIEKDVDRAKILRKVIEERFPNLPENIKWWVYEGEEFASTIERALDELEKEGANMAPSFVFIDPFGFKGFPLRIIRRILKYPSCEVLVTFMEGFIRRFAERNEETLNDLFETDEWKKHLQKETPLVQLYERQLKEKAGAKYTLSFRMIKLGRTLYYLVFATKHIKGLEVMKEAMWRVDPRGQYKFGDLAKGQTTLFNLSSKWWYYDAARLVYQRFAGKTVSWEDIWKFVIEETPYVYRAGILNKLENDGKIVRVEREDGKKRRRGSFKGCIIQFQ